MLVRIVVFVLFSSLVAGCETMEAISSSLGGILDPLLERDNSEPPHELTEYVAEIQPEIIWKEQIGVGSEGMFLKLAPAVVGDKILVADHQGLVQARNPIQGELIWETDIEKPISAGPGIGHHVVLFGTNDAEVVALNPDDGSVLWTRQVSSEVIATPLASQHVAVIHSGDGRLTGLDESSGANLWVYDRAVPPLSLRGTASPIIDGDYVIEGYASGKLASLRVRDGKVEWEANVVMAEGRSELERLVDLDADPLILDGIIYTASFQGGVFAISVHDGKLIWWRRELSAYSGLAGDWTYVYLADESSDVWALEQRNGASLWKQSELHRRQLSPPAIFKDWIVVGDFEGYLHWLSKNDGRLLGRIQISESPIVVKPLVVDEEVYVYTKDGVLAAVVAK
ncbi:MAG: outer membrane protein assembly factor BamB [Methylococcales bacterium]